jgi:hypothetical protein
MRIAGLIWKLPGPKWNCEKLYGEIWKLAGKNGIVKYL